jgi:SAM-dependent methyltransferase
MNTKIELDLNLRKYDKKKWEKISKRHYDERNNLSSASALEDEILISIFSSIENSKLINILDYGAGTGLQSRYISKFVKQVISYEPIKEMRDIMIERTDKNVYNNIKIINNINDTNNLKNIEYIICSRVFEHVFDVSKMLNEFSNILSGNGKLILTLSHPLKFSGDWEKDKNNEYLYYKIYNYFKEGQSQRTRDDFNGKLSIDDISTYHRTLGTYLNLIIENGFTITKFHEPIPSKEIEKTLPALYDRLSRIPNCLILECEKK